LVERGKRLPFRASSGPLPLILTGFQPSLVSRWGPAPPFLLSFPPSPPTVLCLSLFSFPPRFAGPHPTLSFLNRPANCQQPAISHPTPSATRLFKVANAGAKAVGAFFAMVFLWSASSFCMISRGTPQCYAFFYQDIRVLIPFLGLPAPTNSSHDRRLLLL